MKKTLIHGFNSKIESLLEKKFDVVYKIADANRGELSVININHNPFAITIDENITAEYLEFTSFVEKYYYQFCDIFSRNYEQLEITNSEYQNIFSRLIKICVQKINTKSIELAIFSNIPHEGFDFILLKYLQYNEIPFIICYQSIFPNRLYLSDDIDEPYKVVDVKKIQSKLRDNTNNQKIQKKELTTPFYIKNSYRGGPFRRGIIFLKTLIKYPSLITPHLIYWAKTKRYTYRLNRTSTSKYINKNQLYAYFPLHLQPELSTTSLAKSFSDQLKCIEYLSNVLPENFKILIKENPKQKAFKRDKSFFSRLKTIPKTILINKNESSFDLIRGSAFTATINGTAGLEAIKIGKPTVIFGNAWYKDFPGVYFNSELEENLNTILKSEVNTDEIYRLINLLEKELPTGLVDVDYQQNLPSSIKESEAYAMAVDSIYSFSKSIK